VGADAFVDASVGAGVDADVDEPIAGVDMFVGPSVGAGVDTLLTLPLVSPLASVGTGVTVGIDTLLPLLVLSLMAESMMVSTRCVLLALLLALPLASLPASPLTSVVFSSANLTTVEPAVNEYVNGNLSTTAAVFLPRARMAPEACTTREAPAWTESTTAVCCGDPLGPVMRSTFPGKRPVALVTWI